MAKINTRGHTSISYIQYSKNTEALSSINFPDELILYTTFDEICFQGRETRVACQKHFWASHRVLVLIEKFSLMQAVRYHILSQALRCGAHRSRETWPGFFFFLSFFCRFCFCLGALRQVQRPCYWFSLSRKGQGNFETPIVFYQTPAWCSCFPLTFPHSLFMLR